MYFYFHFLYGTQLLTLQITVGRFSPLKFYTTSIHEACRFRINIPIVEGYSAVLCILTKFLLFNCLFTVTHYVG